MQKVRNGLFLKHFGREDYGSLVKLEEHSEECLWELSDFKQILGKQTNGGCYLLTTISKAENEFPVAFLVYESNQNHFHLLNLVVHRAYRRNGYGTILLNHMKNKMNKRFKLLKCDVRDSNEYAHYFLQKNRFIGRMAKRHFRDHYPDEKVKCQDGYLFEYRKEFDDEDFNNGVRGCPVSVNRTS